MNDRLFLSCDWGTSFFRLRLVEWPRLRILAERNEPVGVKNIVSRLPGGASAAARANAFACFLRTQLELLRQARFFPAGTPLMVSGMASSSVGWKELPYAKLPFPLDGSRIVCERVDPPDAALVQRIYLVSGLAAAADILRGEETEILGLFAQPDYRAAARDCQVVFPGTHSKHALIRDGAVRDFRTYMTGELFEVLARHSLLKASVEFPLEPTFGPRQLKSFRAGVVAARDQGLAASLFRVRARQVLSRTAAAENSWFLSGILIGSELAELISNPVGGRVLLAAGEKFSSLYQSAWSAMSKDEPGSSKSRLGRRQSVFRQPELVVLPPDEIKRAGVAAHSLLLGRLGELGRRARRPCFRACLRPKTR